MANSKKNGRNFLSSRAAPPRFSRAFHICVFPTLSCPPHYLRAWNGLFRIRFPSTRIRWIQHTNLQLFESALQSEHFCIRYESGIVRTLIPDIFLSGDITRSSSVLCCEYCIQDGNLVPRFSEGRARCKFRALYDAGSFATIPRGVLGTRTDTCRIPMDGIRLHVDVEIFEPRKKKLRIQKYPDTCGRGLNYINVGLFLVSSVFQHPSSSSSSSSSKLHRSVSFSYVGKKCLQRNGRKLTFPLFWVKPVPSYLDRIMGELSAKQAQK